MVQKRGDLGRVNLARVPSIGKRDKSPDPVNIGLLRARAVVLAADGIPHLVEQPARGRFAGFAFRLIPLQMQRNVLTMGEVDMALLQQGGTRSACFHN